MKIFRGEDHSPFELTLGQDQIWLGQQQYGTTPVYNLTFAFRFPTPVDLEKANAAYSQLLKEAECMRLSIQELDGHAYQTIEEIRAVPLDIVDFSEEAQPEAAYLHWVTPIAQTPVDLSQLVVRPTLAILSPQVVYWVITLHHIAADSWGMYLIYQRFVEMYQALAEGRAVPETRLLPYQTLVEADRQYRASAQFLEDQQYWKQKLREAHGPVRLYGKPVTSETYRAQRVEFTLDASLVEKILRLQASPQFAGRTPNVTLFNILCTAYAAFLYKISDQPGFAIGVPYLNRPGLLRSAPGLTTQQAPLIVHIDPDDTFRTLHRKIQEESASTARHSHYPVPNPHNQVHNVIFNYHNRPYQDETHPAETWWYSGSDNDALALNVINPDIAAGRIRLAFDISTMLLEELGADRLIHHFLAALQAFVDDPDSQIDHLTLMGSEETRAVLAYGNPEMHPPSGTLFLDWFEAQVQRHPDHVAVEDAQAQLTYRQLDAQARRLARRLLAQGVGPGSAVGLWIDRSTWLAPGLLSIFMSGGVFVPLDPSYPAERLRWIAEDARIACILTRQHMAADCPVGDVPVVAIDAFLQSETEEAQETAFPRPDPHATAYIIFTSGSTGRPKGVVVTHAQMAHYLEVERDFLALTPSDRFLYFAALGFDASMEEIFPTWMSGAALVVRPDGMLTLAEFEKLLQEKTIHVLSLPAAFWAEWVTGMEQAGQKPPPYLRMVMVYAEEPSIAHYKTWRRMDPARKIRWINTYGPTESVVTATVFEPGDADDPETWPRFPIGKPLRNHAIYILDKNARPVPPGTPGEITIGGTNASGYHHLPAETARAFLPDPFCEAPGRTMYKTGDRGRQTSSGNFEFLGRMDFQVKLHGFRIELGEIEHWLGLTPGVQQAVVILQKMDTGAEHLIAYLTTETEPAPGAAAVREALKKHLPAYMIPSEFVFLPDLPKTSNGKIDRSALPAVHTIKTEKHYHGAHTIIEAQLVAIWQQVLGISPIGIEDNFFDLGGNSLLGVRLFDLIRHKMGVWLPVASLFKSPTIQKLAEDIQNYSATNLLSCAVLLRPGNNSHPFFFVHGWGGGATGYADLVRALDHPGPIYGIQAAGLLEEQEPDDSMEAMVERYVEAIKSVQPAGPYRLGGYCTGGIIAYAVACALVQQGDAVSFVGIIEGSAPNVPQGRMPLWSPRRLTWILENIPHWVVDYRQLGLIGIRQRFLKKLYEFAEKTNQKRVEPGQYRVSDIILDDPTPLPDYQMRLLLAQLKAISGYMPEEYPGEVVVFVAAYPTLTQAVRGEYDPAMGWAHLARGGVRTRFVKGFHRNIHLPPYSQGLAAAVQEELQHADGSHPPLALRTGSAALSSENGA
jgi:aspartate racemase